MITSRFACSEADQDDVRDTEKRPAQRWLSLGSVAAGHFFLSDDRANDAFGGIVLTLHLTCLDFSISWSARVAVRHLGDGRHPDDDLYDQMRRAHTRAPGMRTELRSA
jgi:hypothetical protein